jgi:hypothetical protein
MMSIFRIIAPVGAALAASALFVSGASADTNTNTNSNTSTQTATTTQSSAAVSGDATASGMGSTAYSGGAFSLAESKTYQTSEQITANQAGVFIGGSGMASASVNGGSSTNTNTNTNASTQTAVTTQDSAAVTGNATASGAASTAYSGWAESIVASKTGQHNAQLAANQVHVFFGLD